MSLKMHHLSPGKLWNLVYFLLQKDAGNSGVMSCFTSDIMLNITVAARLKFLSLLDAI